MIYNIYALLGSRGGMNHFLFVVKSVLVKYSSQTYSLTVFILNNLSCGRFR